jgi:hypothetical protein
LIAHALIESWTPLLPPLGFGGFCYTACAAFWRPFALASDKTGHTENYAASDRQNRPFRRKFWVQFSHTETMCFSYWLRTKPTKSITERNRP